MKPIDWKKLCEDSHNISKEKGWLDTERSFAALTSLMNSELAEALEDWRDNRKVNEIYFEVKYAIAEKNSLGGSLTGEKMSNDALEGLYRHGGATIKSAKPCGIPIELADYAIRLAQYCGTEGLDLASEIEAITKLTRKIGMSDFEKAIGWMMFYTSKSFAISEGDTPFNEPKLHALHFLAQGAVALQDFCFAPSNNVDIAEAIRIKQAYNMTRPHRHGGKKI